MDRSWWEIKNLSEQNEKDAARMTKQAPSNASMTQLGSTRAGRIRAIGKTFVWFVVYHLRVVGLLALAGLFVWWDAASFSLLDTSPEWI